MASEPLLQLAILLLSFLILLFSIKRLANPPRSKPRRNNTTATTTQTTSTNHHFLHLLKPHKPPSPSFLKALLSESQSLISLSPKDPSPRLLRALALDHLGHKGSALRALDSALLMPRVKFMSREERASVLLRRAELKLAVNRRRRVDSAVDDLKECVGLSWDMDDLRVGGLCLLGECYEMKGLWDEAKGAFMHALRVEPECDVARGGLERLRGFGTMEAEGMQFN